jgi:hypothetical protein
MANGPKARNGHFSAYLKRKLGMTQRPTTAGQALFGDVDVTGAQMTEAERRRMGGGR